MLVRPKCVSKGVVLLMFQHLLTVPFIIACQNMHMKLVVSAKSDRKVMHFVAKSDVIFYVVNNLIAIMMTLTIMIIYA